MAKFCNNCGTEATDEALFCSECGAKLSCEDTDTPVNESAGFSEEQYTEQSFEEQPVCEPQIQYIPTTDAPVTEVDESCKVAGVGTFFGLEFLFALPFIGWIICIILAFAPKNKNIKNFARAKLIWIVIGIVFFAVFAATVFILGSVVSNILKSTAISSLNELINNFVNNSIPASASEFEWLEDILSSATY